MLAQLIKSMVLDSSISYDSANDQVMGKSYGCRFRSLTGVLVFVAVATGFPL